MILFDNGFVKLDFDPTTDILFVDMPNVDMVYMPEVIRTLDIIVEHVRNYDIKKLLIDARKTKVEVSEEEYAGMISRFLQNLLATRLQKLARIVSCQTVRENVVKQVYTEKNLPLNFQSFVDIPPALVWLRQ